MAITIRRRSKKQQALRAARSTGKKAAKAKVVVGTTKAARKGVGTAAKTGAFAVAYAKTRKPLLAIGAIAGGAAIAMKLKSASSRCTTDSDTGAAESAPATPAATSTPEPAMAGAANGTGPTAVTPPAV